MVTREFERYTDSTSHPDISDQRMTGVFFSEDQEVDLTDEEALREMMVKLLEGKETGHKINIIPSELLEKAMVERVMRKLSDDMFREPLIQVVHYLELPIVEDGFDTNDIDRRAWEAEVEVIYGKLGVAVLSMNRLRANEIGNTAGQIYNLVSMLPLFYPELTNDLEEIGAAIDQRAFAERDLTEAEINEILGKLENGGSDAQRRVVHNMKVRIYKSLSRSDKQEIVDSVAAASARLLQVLDEAEITPLSDENVGGPNMIPTSAVESLEFAQPKSQLPATPEETTDEDLDDNSVDLMMWRPALYEDTDSMNRV